MSKKLLKFLTELECSENDTASVTVANFIRGITGYSEAVNNAELNGQLDHLINIAKMAKNQLKTRRNNKENEVYED